MTTRWEDWSEFYKTKASFPSLSNRDKPRKYVCALFYIHSERADLLQDKVKVGAHKWFPVFWASFLPKFYVKSLTWNLGSQAPFLRRLYTFNTVVILSGWENVSWQMQRKQLMKKRDSGSQRHWNRMSKVLSVLSTCGKETVPATRGESDITKSATAKRLSASHFCDFMKLWQPFA